MGLSRPWRSSILPKSYTRTTHALVPPSSPLPHILRCLARLNMSLDFAVILCGLIAVVTLLHLLSLTTTVKAFPGPPRGSITGRTLQSGRIWIKLAEIGRTYGKRFAAICFAYVGLLDSVFLGSVFSLPAFRTRIIVINSAVAAHELLELRSAKYANRRLTPMVKL